MAAPAGKGFVEGLESPWLEGVFCPFLVLDVEPHPQSMLVPGVIIFVSGELSGGGDIVLELSEPAEPLLIEFLLSVGGVPAGEAAEQDDFWCGEVPVLVGASLLADPGVQGLFDRVAVVVGEPAVEVQEVLGFCQAPAPFCAGGFGVPGGEGCLMGGA